MTPGTSGSQNVNARYGRARPRRQSRRPRRTPRTRRSCRPRRRRRPPASAAGSRACPRRTPARARRPAASRRTRGTPPTARGSGSPRTGTRRPARVARAHVLERVAHAGRGRRRQVGELLRDPRRPAAAVGPAAEPALEIGRHQRDRQPDGERDAREHGRHDGEAERRLAGEQPDPQAQPAVDQRRDVREVGGDQERWRLVATKALGHPGAPQGPGGQHLAAGAAGRRSARPQARHRDLCLAPADPGGRRPRRARTRRGTSSRSRRTCRP